jgi:hypothetical protein
MGDDIHQLPEECWQIGANVSAICASVFRCQPQLTYPFLKTLPGSRNNLICKQRKRYNFLHNRNIIL